jgi:deoxyribonuclease-4
MIVCHQFINFRLYRLSEVSIKLGVHVSISGSLSKSIDNALGVGCSAFQIFTRSPRQWKTKDIPKEEATLFINKLKESPIDDDSVIAHMPYLPNLSAPEGEMYQKSLKALEDEVKRCSLLHIPFLVVHLGSHLGEGSKNGISQLIKACKTAMGNHSDNSGKNGVKLLLENSSGQKNSIGSSIEEIAEIFDRLNSRSFGLCLDTCHAFAAGYDLSAEKGVTHLLDLISDNVGIDRLNVIHLNDSKGELGANLDRHYHIGIGKIGRGGFKFLLNVKKLHNIPFIMETPIDDVRNNLDNIEYVKSLLNGD